MSSTSHLRNGPDFFNTKEERDMYKRNRVQTNPKYKHFTHTHFTAGNEGQFEMYRDSTNGELCIPKINIINNLYKDLLQNNIWDGYKDLEATCVKNTFNYLFYKFKKGIFVKIQNNELKVFLPFSNNNYTNEWSDKILYDPSRFNSMNEFFEYVSKLDNRPFKAHRINKFTNAWYANNCLIRNEFPISEGDAGVHQFSDMFHTLCQEREIPDMEFFINKRDFPLLKRNKTEPYDHMFGKDKPLLSHNYDKYAPIFGGATNSNFADISIPTWDDWARVNPDKIFFKSSESFEIFNISWKNKKPIAIFRGGSTGCGVDIETNPRLKVAYMSSLKPKDDDGSLLLDAGITNWNVRPRKLQNEKYLKTIEIDKLNISLVERVSPKDQAGYKYIINIDGHVTAFRLSLELGMGSVVLLVESDYSIWYMKYLKSYTHYIPIKKDLSDLLEKIKWCKKNDKKCEKIAKNAKDFYDKYLCKKGILDYLQMLLICLKKKTGVYLYNYKTPLQLQIEYEEKQIPKIKNTFLPKIYDIPLMENDGGFYDAIKDLYLNGIPITIKKNIKKLSDSNIDLGVMINYPVVIKNSNKEKISESIHETYIALNALNELSKIIPNFAYIFGMDNNYNVCLEYIDGITLFEYIQSKDFCMKEYAYILLQISAALEIAQKKYGFVHWDLMPWNIMLKRYKNPLSVNYNITSSIIISIDTKIVPVIIDYGKSHIISNNIHVGYTKMFQMSKSQDIYTLIVSSINQIIKYQNIDKKELDYILNFLGENLGYTMKDIRASLYKMSKYTNIVNRKQTNIDNKRPYDFINHIMRKYKFPFVYHTNQTFSVYDNSNTRQIKMFCSEKSKEKRLNTYIRTIKSIRDCIFNNNSNLIYKYFTIQSIYTNIKHVYEQGKRYAYDNNFDTQKLDREMELSVEHLSNSLDLDINPKKINYTIENPKIILYDKDTFLLPDVILEKLEHVNIIEKTNILNFKYILESIITYQGKFQLPDDLRQFYINHNNRLLHIDNFDIMKKTSNGYTLSFLAKKVYKNNINYIEKEKMNQRDGDFKDIDNILNTYNKILII